MLGWGVRRSTPDVAVLGARSRLGLPGELAFVREADSVTVVTLVQLRNPLARAMWAAVAPRHRQVVPHLLRRAATRAGLEVRSGSPARGVPASHESRRPAHARGDARAG